MNCEHVKSLLNDYVDDSLSTDLAGQVESHLHACSACSAETEALRRQQDIMRSLPVPVPGAGFQRRAVDQAVAATGAAGRASSSNSRLLTGFALAAALSALVIWTGFIDIDRHAEQPHMMFVADEVRNINVAIDSEEELEAVSMHVEISDNLELKGFGSRRTISWTTDLKPGANVISLPIIGIARGDGEITTRVMMNGKQKVMRIRTRYRTPGNVYLDGIHLAS